ncbi:MAG: hypothetical protein N4A46_00250 [Schleiferiaceae bacterium]|jgi:hypothetical protein|nr:hypothetical protein [Schleiferiaceae bacterium]
MKKIKEKIKDIIKKDKTQKAQKSGKLTHADVEDIKSAITEIELRDR